MYRFQRSTTAFKISMTSVVSYDIVYCRTALFLYTFPLIQLNVPYSVISEVTSSAPDLELAMGLLRARRPALAKISVIYGYTRGSCREQFEWGFAPCPCAPTPPFHSLLPSLRRLGNGPFLSPIAFPPNSFFSLYTRASRILGSPGAGCGPRLLGTLSQPRSKI